MLRTSKDAIIGEGSAFLVTKFCQITFKVSKVSQRSIPILELSYG